MPSSASQHPLLQCQHQKPFTIASQASSVGQLQQTKLLTSSTMHTGVATKAFVLSLTPAWAPSSKSAPSESPCAKLPMGLWTQPRSTCLTNLPALRGTGREGISEGSKGHSPPPKQHRTPLNRGHQ